MKTVGRFATNFEGVYHKHQNQGRVPGVFLLPSKDQKHGMLVQVRDVLEDMHREENPVFFVQWAKMQTGDPRNIALVNAVINEINMNKQELVHLLVEPEVQQLLHAELLKNRGPDGKYSVPAPTRGGMQTSYLTVVAPPDDAGFLRKPPKPARACAQCGAAAAHACSRCQAVYYCSRAHQTAHWRTGGHKAACRSAAEAAGARGVDAASGSVVIAATAPPEWAEKFAGVPGFAHQANISLLRGTVHKSTIKPGKKQRAPTNVHGDGTFLVKLQVPMGGSGGFLPIMIYDKERSFDRMLMPDEPGFDKLGEITRREPAFQGTKIYLNAKREADTFRIFLSPVPPQRQYF